MKKRVVAQRPEHSKHPMPLVTCEQLSDRLINHTRDTYLFIYSVMKGATVANAAYVLATLARGPSSSYASFSLWLAAFGALVVTQVTTMRGLVLSALPQNLLDTVFPLGLAIAEFLLFSVLQKDGNGPAQYGLWFLVLGVHGFLAAAIVTNRRRQMSHVDYEASLHELMDYSLRFLRKDQFGATVNGICWSSVAALAFAIHLPDRVYLALGLVVAAVMGTVAFLADRERQYMSSWLRAKHDDGQR